MASLPKIKHILTIGTEKYSLRVPDVYGNFAGSTGIVKAPNPDTTVYTGKVTKDDYSNGKLMRLKCTATSGSGSTKKTKAFTVLCALDKAKSALASLESKTISVADDGTTATWDITNAYVPQRRRFS